MDERNIIRLSFAQLSKGGNDFAKVFYDNLFEMAPLIKPMFKSDRDTIEKHFYELISFAVNEVEHFEDFKPQLRELGKRHKEYGAQIEHFTIIKTAFMLSLQYNLKGQFDELSETAWSKYVDIIAQEVIEGIST